MAGRRRAVGIALLRLAAAQHRGDFRFADDDLRLRPFLAQHPRHALQRAAGAEPGHPVVERLAVEIVEDLARRGARMHVGVGLVFKLPGQKPAVGLRQLVGLGDHAGAFVLGRRQHHLAAEKAHQLAPFDAEALRHGDHQRIALLGAHHGQPDTRIAAGCLNHRLPRLQLARPLGRLNDAKRQPVLDRAERIERLDLDVEIDAGRRQLVDLDDRRLADRFQNIGEFAAHGVSPL